VSLDSNGLDFGSLTGEPEKGCILELEVLSEVTAILDWKSELERTILEACRGKRK
jgi:hypothetical protein